MSNEQGGLNIFMKKNTKLNTVPISFNLHISVWQVYVSLSLTETSISASGNNSSFSLYTNREFIDYVSTSRLLCVFHIL